MNTPELSPQNSELLSALADGELIQTEVCALLKTCQHNPAALASWNSYHAIGGVLRTPGSPAQLADLAFLTRLNQQLAKEPALAAEHKTFTPPLTPTPGFSALPVPVPVPVPAAISLAGERREVASNDAHFRWKVLAGIACTTAVFAITWSVSGSILPNAGLQLAQSGTSAGGTVSSQVVVASPQGPVVRDARLEELLAAHKQLGATSAWPVPSGFLRNATFETQQSPGR